MVEGFWRRSAVQVLAVALASALAGGAAALALRTDSADPTDAARSDQLAEIPATLASRFRIFRMPARTSDRISVREAGSRRSAEQDDAADIDAEYVRRNHLNLALGRRLRTSPRAFAIPGRGIVCLVYAHAGGGCTPNAFVGRDFQVHTCGHLPTGLFEVSGLVPDTVKAAFLRLRDRRRVPLRIRRNFVILRARAVTRGELPAVVELRGTRLARWKVSPLRLRDLSCAERE